MSKRSKMEMYLIAGLISVVDSFLRHHFWGEKVGEFAKVDTISQSLLQFCGSRQVLLQAGLHPPDSSYFEINCLSKHVDCMELRSG